MAYYEKFCFMYEQTLESQLKLILIPLFFLSLHQVMSLLNAADLASIYSKVIALYCKRSIFLTMTLLLTILSPMVVASSTSQVNTTVSIQSNYSGNISNGGFVYTSANPTFSFGVNNPNNAHNLFNSL